MDPGIQGLQYFYTSKTFFSCSALDPFVKYKSPPTLISRKPLTSFSPTKWILPKLNINETNSTIPGAYDYERTAIYKKQKNPDKIYFFFIFKKNCLEWDTHYLKHFLRLCLRWIWDWDSSQVLMVVEPLDYIYPFVFPPFFRKNFIVLLSV